MMNFDARLIVILPRKGDEFVVEGSMQRADRCRFGQRRLDGDDGRRFRHVPIFVVGGADFLVRVAVFGGRKRRGNVIDVVVIVAAEKSGRREGASVFVVVIVWRCVVVDRS